MHRSGPSFGVRPRDNSLLRGATTSSFKKSVPGAAPEVPQESIAAAAVKSARRVFVRTALTAAGFYALFHSNVHEALLRQQEQNAKEEAERAAFREKIAALQSQILGTGRVVTPSGDLYLIGEGKPADRLMICLEEVPHEQLPMVLEYLDAYGLHVKHILTTNEELSRSDSRYVEYADQSIAYMQTAEGFQDYSSRYETPEGPLGEYREKIEPQDLMVRAIEKYRSLEAGDPDFVRSVVVLHRNKEQERKQFPDGPAFTNPFHRRKPHERMYGVIHVLPYKPSYWVDRTPATPAMDTIAEASPEIPLSPEEELDE